MVGRSWCGSALLQNLAGLDDGPAVPLGPDPNPTESFAQTFAKLRQLVLDPWRDHWTTIRCEGETP